MKKVTSFFNMKKFVLGAVACAALVLLMPSEAKAETITDTLFCDTEIGDSKSDDLRVIHTVLLFQKDLTHKNL